jgi:hypothetical protein
MLDYLKKSVVGGLWSVVISTDDGLQTTDKFLSALMFTESNK